MSIDIIKIIEKHKFLSIFLKLKVYLNYKFENIFFTEEIYTLPTHVKTYTLPTHDKTLT